MDQPDLLFREEVLLHRRQTMLGEVRVPRNLPGFAIAVAIVVLIVGALALLLAGQFTRKATVQGQLVPAAGLGTIVAPIDGVLSSLPVAEGDYVEAGAVLAVIRAQQQIGSGSAPSSFETFIAQRRQQLEAEDASNVSLAERQRDGLEKRSAALASEIGRANTELEHARGRAALSRDALARFRRLESGGSVSTLQRIAQEEQALAQESLVEEAERLVSRSRRELSELEQQVAELPARLEAQRATIRRALAALEQEAIAMRVTSERVVAAPFAGVVASLRFQPGQPLTANQIVMTLLPRDATLQAHLLVPSRAIGFVSEGDRVQLRYHAFPYQKFGHQAGRITKVSRSALAPAEVEGLLLSPADRYYRVVVALDRQTIRAYGKSEALRPGMLMDADILLERRRLIEWLFEPLYAMRSRFVEGES